MIELVTAPTTLLATLEQLKSQLFIEHTLDDVMLNDFLEVASNQYEHDTDLAIRSQVWLQTNSQFYSVHNIEKNPVSSIEVNYYDVDNSLTTLASSAYYVVANKLMASIEPVDDWPETYDRPDAVQITINAGLDYIPVEARQAVREYAAAMYEHRTSLSGSQAYEKPQSYSTYVKNLRRGFIV